MKMNDYVYLYDGSFWDLMNLIEYLLQNKIKPLDIKSETFYQSNLIDETRKPILDGIKDPIQKIMKNISKMAFHTVYYVYLSEDKNKELIIYYYLLNGYKYGAKISYLRNLKCVNKALGIEHYVGRENHKLKGFLRFRELKNQVLYAEISPENNILSLLSKHFVARLKEENWLIKDVKRNLISIYNKKDYCIVDGAEFKFINFELNDQELEFERLWKLFYKTIAIEERKNLKCQRNFMPKKYWKYILEVSEETNEKSNKWN